MACRPFSRKISICRGSLWLISYCWSRDGLSCIFLFNKDWQFHWKKKKEKKEKKEEEEEEEEEESYTIICVVILFR